MTYKDIIQGNCESHSRVRWWPKFAFHFTDVQNAASILTSGRLYSRATAQNLNVMLNDNASRQVIDMTCSDVISNVRFYFRPQTPTQYYNEGYKHRLLRFRDDVYANIPVPVFFLFDLEKVLALPNVMFSEMSQAGHGANTYHGVDAFSKLNFDNIYDNSSARREVTKLYRHAEILIPDFLDIDNLISRILCRNNVERTTLLNILKEKVTKERFERFKDIIKVHAEDVFYRNGYYVEDCEYHRDCIIVSFSDTPAKKSYIQSAKGFHGVQTLPLVEACYHLEWLDANDDILKVVRVNSSLDIEKNVSCKLSPIPNVVGAVRLGIKVFIDRKLMCYVIRSLLDSELLD